MEVKDFLALLRHRLWIVVLVAAVAGIGVAGLTLRSPSEYRATATVAVPGLVGGEDGVYSGTNGQRAFVANYIAVVESQATARAVATETGVPFNEVRSGLAATEVGESSLVKISFTTERRDTAERVAADAAGRALAFVFEPQSQRATASVSEAEAAVAAAQQALDAFLVETGQVDPDRSYQLQGQHVTALEQQALAAAARGEAAVAASLAAAVKIERAELDAMAPVLSRFRQLADTQRRALDRRDAALTKLEAARDRSAAADPTTAVSLAPTVTVSRLPAAVQKGAAAVAAATFLVLLVLFVLESALRPRAGYDSEAGPALSPPA